MKFQVFMLETKSFLNKNVNINVNYNVKFMNFKLLKYRLIPRGQFSRVIYVQVGTYIYTYII